MSDAALNQDLSARLQGLWSLMTDIDGAHVERLLAPAEQANDGSDPSEQRAA